MKEFIVESKKYGDKKIMIDEEDWVYVSSYKWNLRFSNKFYVIANGKYFNGKRQKQINLHRLIMNAKDGQVIDHKDGNTLNNQKSNLRFATIAQNAQNYTTPKNNSTGYKGVSLRHQYRAYIVVDRKQKFLGHFNTAKAAAIAYNEAAIKYFGEFAKLNEV